MHDVYGSQKTHAPLVVITQKPQVIVSQRHIWTSPTVLPNPDVVSHLRVMFFFFLTVSDVGW